MCRFVIIPDMLKNAPMFKRIDPKFRVRACSLPLVLPWFPVHSQCALPGIELRSDRYLPGSLLWLGLLPHYAHPVTRK